MDLEVRAQPSENQEKAVQQGREGCANAKNRQETAQQTSDSLKDSWNLRKNLLIETLFKLAIGCPNENKS